MNTDLELALDILRPLTYVVAEEEDKVIEDIYNKTKSNSELFIYRATMGLMDYSDYISDEKKKKSNENNGIIDALEVIYHGGSTDKRSIYVLLDIDGYLIETTTANMTIIRKFKDIILQMFKDQIHLKTVIIVSPDLVVPKKLQRYIEVVYYDLPTEPEVQQKVNQILDDYNSTVDEKNKKVETLPKDCRSMLQSFKGLTMFEVHNIVLSSIKRFKKLKMEEINDYKKGILRKTTLLEIMDTNISFKDVGGMERLKEWLVKREGAWTEEGIAAGVPMLKGLLLIGITGCGKSHISKAIANQWGLPLVAMNPGKVFSPRIGESENNMMKALKIVESIAPCVLVIDEIEKGFAGSQSSSFSDAGTTSRVIGNFLTWYQDNTYPIFIVATCNSIQYLPPELVSRFDDKFFVNIPNKREREAIFDIQLRKYGKDWRNLKIQPTTLATLSEHLTGREIEQVIKSSIYEMFYEKRTTNKDIDLEQRHIEKVLQNKIPILKTMEDEIKFLIQWVGWDEDRRDGIRANYANIREEDQADDIEVLLNETLKSSEDFTKKFKRKQGDNDGLSSMQK